MSCPPVRSTHPSYRPGLDSALVSSPTPSPLLPPRVSSGARWRLAWHPQLLPSTPSSRCGASRGRSSSCPWYAAPAPRPPGSCRQSPSRWLRSVRLRPCPTLLRGRLVSSYPSWSSPSPRGRIYLATLSLGVTALGKSPPRLPPVPQSSYWSFSPGSISSRLSVLCVFYGLLVEAKSHRSSSPLLSCSVFIGVPALELAQTHAACLLPKSPPPISLG